MPESVSVTVKLFAVYRDMLGQTEMTLQAASDESVANLFARLLGDRAAPALRDATLFAVNESYVPADTILNDGDRIAFIPPVAGG